MDRKGLEHIEFILSFVLFIGFLLFALYFFSPLRDSRVVESVLFYAYDEVSSNLTTILEKTSVSIDSSVSSQVIGFQLDNEYSAIQVVTPERVILPAYYSNGLVIIDRQNSENRFFSVLMGNELKSNTFEADNYKILDDSNYTIGSSDEEKLISESTAIVLKSRYDSEEGYFALKEEFNLPRRVDFAFTLDINGEKLEATRNVPEGIEVFARNERVEVLRTDGSVTFADLRVSVW